MSSRAQKFESWRDDYLEWYFRSNPVNATFVGKHAYDHLLPNYSESGLGSTLADLEQFQKSLAGIPGESLSAMEELDRLIAEGALEIQQWEIGSTHFHRGNPSLYTGEAVFGVISLLLRPFAPLSDRIEMVVKRLEATPAFLRQGQANIRSAPLLWVQNAIKECRGAQIIFTSGIGALIQDESISHPQLRESSEVAAAAYEDFQKYLTDELLIRSTENYASGPDALHLLTSRGHFLSESLEEIEAYATDQLQQSISRLTSEARGFGSNSWQQVLARLHSFHPTKNKYLSTYKDMWNASKSLAVEKDLLTWPDYPIEYVFLPRWAREAAPYLYFLHYRAPAAFDDVPIHQYLVPKIKDDATDEDQTHFLESVNDSVIKLNHVVHHGGIGHHVQNWHAYRSESRFGQIAAVDCATRIAFFSGGTMAEGWSCYTTDLMDESGFLTPLESFSQIHYRAKMAARAVADIKLHTNRNSINETISFYEEAIGMTRDAATAEAVKNSMYPGTGLMYLMGNDQILDLRHKMSTVLGHGFRLKEFHDRFLSFGSIPVSLIAKSMIASSRQSNGRRPMTNH